MNSDKLRRKLKSRSFSSHENLVPPSLISSSDPFISSTPSTKNKKRKRKNSNKSIDINSSSPCTVTGETFQPPLTLTPSLKSPHAPSHQNRRKRSKHENNSFTPVPENNSSIPVSTIPISTAPSTSALSSLQSSMKLKLEGAKFRWLNEKLYT